jgi:hypothetical protein
VRWPFHATLLDLARWADVLMIAVRAGPGNRHAVDARVLAALGSDGHVVNITRGSVIDEAALVRALADGTIAGAGLDVFEQRARRPRRAARAAQRRDDAAPRRRRRRGAGRDARGDVAQPRGVRDARRGRPAGARAMKLAVRGQPVYAYTGTRAFDPAKPTVAFVHGAAHDHSVWLLQSRYFANHRRNALAFDLPGHGRSGGAALASVEAIADWLVDASTRPGSRARRSSAIRSARSPRSRARRAIRRASRSSRCSALPRRWR